MASRDPARPARRIQSIDVGFQVIRVLEQSRGKIALKRIASEAGMPPSKAYLYLSSFIDLGLVVQDDLTGHYGLGTYAVQLGLAAMRQLSILDVSRDPLERLQIETGCSAYLSIWGNMGPVIILKYDSDANAPVGIKVGSVLPLLRSATGRIFLHYMPEPDLRPVLLREGVRKRAVSELREASSAEIGSHGVAVSDSQVYAGFAALSAPVFDHAGSLSGSLTLLGLTRHFRAAADGEAACLLKDAARRVSINLGFEAEPVAGDADR